MDHKFSADRPIRTPDEDRFDRASFVSSLVSAISGWHSQESLVISLCGEWGTGKTSLKNLVLTALSTSTIPPVPVIEFTPWEWSGQQKIPQAFFNEFATGIGGKDTTKSQLAIASKLRLYSLRLQAGSVLTEGLQSLIPWLMTAAAFLGLWGTSASGGADKATFAIAVILLMTISGFLKWGGKLSTSLSEIIIQTAKDSEMSVEKLKTSIAAELRKIDRPILIVIDDIDRLTPQEARSVFQLVKANANFPNTVYLLLFQRDIVERQLTNEAQDGAAFLEKIVQVPFDLPPPDRPRIEKLLFESLDSVLAQDPSILKRFDQTRWGNIYHGGLHKYFRTPRNVHRYISTLSFYTSLLQGERAFEVNPIDLIAVEVLRVFEPAVHKAIAGRKQFLTRSHDDHRQRDEAVKEIEHILDLATQTNRAEVQDIIKQLFPTIENLMGGYGYGAEFSEKWLKSLRVCCCDIFDRYFQFAIPDGEVSQSELEAVLDLSNDQLGLVARLESLRERKLLHPALSYLDTYKQDVPLEHSDNFLAALMDIADETRDVYRGFTGITSSLHLSRIVNWYLRQSDSTADRGARLLSAFNRSSGLSLMAAVLSSDEARREKPDESRELLMNDEFFAEGKDIFVSKIKAVAESHPETLINNLHLASLLYRWKAWGEQADVGAWAKRTATTPDMLLKFLDTFVTQSYTQGWGDYVGKTKNRIRLSDIEEFVSAEEVRELLATVDKSNATERENEILDAVERAFRRREAGHAEDSFLDDDE